MYFSKNSLKTSMFIATTVKKGASMLGRQWRHNLKNPGRDNSFYEGGAGLNLSTTFKAAEEGISRDKSPYF